MDASPNWGSELRGHLIEQTAEAGVARKGGNRQTHCHYLSNMRAASQPGGRANFSHDCIREGATNRDNTVVTNFSLTTSSNTISNSIRMNATLITVIFVVVLDEEKKNNEMTIQNDKKESLGFKSWQEEI